MKRFNITVNGKPFDVTCEEVGIVAVPPAPLTIVPPAPLAPVVVNQSPSQLVVQTQQQTAVVAVEKAGSIEIKAPIPGNINAVKVAIGQAVKSGDVIVILEAMKMENEIMAPQDGKIISINVTQGDTVNSEQVICTME